jgi:hypothetical protein
MVIEVGLDRVSIEPTLLRGDLPTFDADIERVAKRADQVATKVEAVRRFELTYVAGPAATVIWPVIVLIDGFLQGGVLGDRVAQSIARTYVARQAGAAPLAILGLRTSKQLWT